jgi:hypothetical protein
MEVRFHSQYKLQYCTQNLMRSATQSEQLQLITNRSSHSLWKVLYVSGNSLNPALISTISTLKVLPPAPSHPIFAKKSIYLRQDHLHQYPSSLQRSNVSCALAKLEHYHILVYIDTQTSLRLIDSFLLFERQTGFSVPYFDALFDGEHLVCL